MKKYYRFLISFVLLLLSCFLLEQTKQLSDKDYYSIMLDASQRTQDAFEAVKKEKLSRGITISSLDDPNNTGMIGDPFTEITTTLGNLEAKRSTTNPNISAMIVDMLMQCNVKSGDTVAVNFSGSFPAVNIATLCAMDAMGLKGTVISSVGASTYGGNQPEFTYLDMEHFLYEQGYIKNHSRYFSMGGSNDQGKEMPEDLKEGIRGRIEGYGTTFLNYESIDENIEARTAIYKDTGESICFINAGGNQLSFGGGSEMVSAKNGIIRPTGGEIKGKGLVPVFLNSGVPVIHLLNMKGLLPSYGLPIDPMPIPPVGAGGVYRHYEYHIGLAVILLLLNSLWLIWAAKKYPHQRFPF